MTTLDAGPARPGTAEELRSVLAQADPALLVNCLIQLTGDTGLLERYGPHFTPVAVRSILESHTVDGAIVDEIVDRMVTELVARDGEPLPPPTMVDPELFRRMAAFCVGEPVDAEFVPILEEQTGFVNSRRVVPVTRKPPPEFNVIVIGAGMTGINAAIKLAEAGFSYQVFESRHEIGGTWSVNKYPGAAVDTPSAYYSFSFEPNPAWTHFYPVGDEYHEYMKRVADKYGITEHITFNTAVVGCEWHEDRQRWIVRTSTNGGEVTEHEAAAVVTALGFLNRPNIPDIPGRDAFQGSVVHSAQWDPDLDLVGKRVVLLGAGCSAVQIAEAVAGDVASLTVVQQQPHWIRPMKATHGKIPEALRWVICNVPHYQRWFRLKTYWYASDNIYPIPRIDPEWYATHVSSSPANDALMQVCLKYIEASFPDQPELRAKLTPDFPPFAKRIIGDPGYYKALQQPNVDLVTGTIERYESDGVIVSGGQKIDCDVVVLATGFTLDFLRTVDITGRNDTKLTDVWGDDPRGYLGMMVPGFPNLFTTCGPNSAANHGGGHNLTAEEQVHYIIESLQYLVEHDATSMEPTQEATDAYNQRVDEELDMTVWQHGGSAHGYYRNAKGRAGIACPWRMVDYWSMLRAPKPEELIITPAARQAVLGHLALHYMPGDEHQARRLLELLGCTLVDNGPSPGSDGFCTVLVNGTDANYADNIMFLSAVTPEQAAVEAAIRDGLRAGEPNEDPAVGKFRESIAVKPESTSHIGLRFRNLEGLESTLAGIEAATGPGGELEGRAQLVKYPPRPGDDPAAFGPVAERMAASPAFSGQETPSFAPYWIQCFVTTDLCGFGILTFGSTFELDYVFDPFFNEPPTFGRRRN